MKTNTCFTRLPQGFASSTSAGMKLFLPAPTSSPVVNCKSPGAADPQRLSAVGCVPRSGACFPHLDVHPPGRVCSKFWGPPGCGRPGVWSILRHGHESLPSPDQSRSHLGRIRICIPNLNGVHLYLLGCEGKPTGSRSFWGRRSVAHFD